MTERYLGQWPEFDDATEMRNLMVRIAAVLKPEIGPAVTVMFPERSLEKDGKRFARWAVWSPLVGTIAIGDDECHGAEDAQEIAECLMHDFGARVANVYTEEWTRRLEHRSRYRDPIKPEAKQQPEAEPE